MNTNTKTKKGRTKQCMRMGKSHFGQSIILISKFNRLLVSDSRQPHPGAGESLRALQEPRAEQAGQLLRHLHGQEHLLVPLPAPEQAEGHLYRSGE